MTADHRPRPDLAALSPWAPELARTFVSLASDIALVIDDSGVIRNVAQGTGEPIAPGADEWIGRAWIDTVSGETRRKIESLLSEVASTGIARRREVNHMLGAGASVPVAYTAIRLGANGPVLAVGRDLRTIAAIQQRFVETQQDMERGYWQVRQAETRYQVLFQVATDAVFVVDAETLLITEANQAAAKLFGSDAEQLQGRHASAAFEHHSRVAVNQLLDNARASGQSGEIRARLMGTTLMTTVAATPFRADNAMRLLVRVRQVDAGSTASLNKTLARLVDDSRDGVVVTDSSGRVLLANPAFVQLLGLNGEADLRGQPLADWLGVADQKLGSLLPKVRLEGIARRVDSWARQVGKAPVRVEISAALLTEGDQECIGFTVHPASASGSDAARAEAAGAVFDIAASQDASGADATLIAGLQKLASRLGQVPLPLMLAEAAALHEHHFLQLALERSNGDSDAAAMLLGIDRAQWDQRAGRMAPAQRSSSIGMDGR